VLTTEFDRWWNSPGTWVEPANQRRGGESGVRLLQRDPARPPLYCKQQTGHTYRTLLHPFGRPTILRELHAYRAFARLGIRTPKLVYCAARRQQGHWQALLVTEALQDFVSLEQWYASNENRALREAVLRELATTLARLHLSGWQHGCCYPKHIFVNIGDCGDDTQVEIALLDLEKSRRRWCYESASRHDLRQLERHRGNIPEADLLIFRDAYCLTLDGVRRSWPP
jgi:tRNA A-37 threonylcarbamoyl transferase component Bud32